MAYHLVQDPDGSTVMQEDAQGGGESGFKVRFASGAEASIEVAADGVQTVLGLQSPDGTLRFLTISNANAVAASATKP